MHLNHDFYFVVGKQCRIQKMSRRYTISLFVSYEIDEILLIYFHVSKNIFSSLIT